MATRSLAERRFLWRLRRRDEDAFSELVEQHKHMVFGVSYRLLGDREEAEDLAQDVFVTVFKRLDGFRGESSLRTWIYTIALNLSRNRLRARDQRRYREHQSLEEHGDALQLATDPRPESLGDDPTRGVDREEALVALHRALDALAPEAREVLVLRDLDELAYEDIAALLELPVGTVKSRIFRARAALRQLMEEPS